MQTIIPGLQLSLYGHVGRKNGKLLGHLNGNILVNLLSGLHHYASVQKWLGFVSYYARHYSEQCVTRFGILPRNCCLATTKHVLGGLKSSCHFGGEVEIGELG
jgi:hypothetical protein